MNTALYIARRYLFAKKSHNVINVISAVSVAGMAIGTAALILVLSVYNGFDSIVKDNLSDLDPDIAICHTQGKFFDMPEDLYFALRDNPGVASIGSVVQDNVFLIYGDKQEIALAKGVEDATSLPLASHMLDGEFALHKGDLEMACVGSGLAYKAGIRTRFVTPIELYYPERDGKVSPSNPTAALRKEKVYTSGIFSVNATIDEELIVLPVETMRNLLGLESDALASSIEIRLKDPSDKSMKAFAKDCRALLGDEWTVLDRYGQHPSLYRMMKLEKAAIFLILIFMVIIIAFNIFGALSMLIIEKKEDIATLRALGADGKLTRRIFVLEGWLISLAGLLIGLVAGILLAYLQMKTGIVKMPGNYLISAYPVVVKASDVLLTALGVALVGYATAVLSVKGQNGATFC